VASLLKIGFWNVEDKVGNKDFVYCLNERDMCRAAGSWTGGEVYGFEGYESCVKGSGSAAFGRNPGGSMREEIRRKVVEIPAVAKDVMWLVVKQSDGFLCIGVLVLYITSRNHEMLQPTFSE
jgi:hypothetical protein